MEKPVLSMPGYRINEYLLVLKLPEAIWRKIEKVKEAFAHAYEAPQARWGKPHITLARFVQYELMESRIVNHIKTISMGQYPFKIELQNFGSFPSHTVFIQMATRRPLQQLVQQLRSQTQKLMKFNEENKPHFITDPVITVATNLQPGQHHKAWTEYNKKHFTGKFIADSLLLLKRPVNGKNYQIAERFIFQNLPVSVKQGELFA